MSTKALEENLKKLCGLGFSKTKAQKALKDTGNNFSKAKEMLDRLQQQQEREEKQQEVIKRKLDEEEERKKQAVERKALGLEPEPSTADKKPERLHPCIVQYKSCRYGKFCLLRDLPGDVCIAHFNSACLYGSACRNRHSIDGVDIRHYVPNAPNAPYEGDGAMLRRDDGASVVPLVSYSGGVQLATVVYPNGTPPSHDRPALPLPAEYSWNAIKGSEASYSDPLPAAMWGEDGMNAAMAQHQPTPFLDSLRTQPSTVQRPSRQVVHSIEPAVPARPVRYGEPGFIAHPCITQCGDCKYGDHCLHTTRPADVCVHYLNGRCNFDASQCRYRHEDALTMIPAPSLQAVQQGTAHRVAPQSVGPAPKQPSPSLVSSTSPSVGYVLKPNAVVGGMSMWSLNESLASREQSLLEKQYAPPQQWQQGGEPVSLLPLLSSDSKNSAKGHTPTLAASYTVQHNSSMSSSGGTPTSPQMAAASNADDERRSFVALRDVFPQVDPQLLLHALRLAGGDRQHVAEALTATHACDPCERIDAMLSAAVAEESIEGGWGVPSHACSSDALLSLCSAFPNLDVPIVEEALRSSNGDAADAYAMLVCSAEHIVSSVATGGKWSTLSSAPAADMLKVQRLMAMFRDLPDDVITQCFEAAGGSTQKCIEALTQLVADSDDGERKGRSDAGAAAMRGEMPPAPDTGGTGGFVVSSGTSSGFSVVGSAPLPSQSELYHKVCQEASENGDWRRLRERAYLVNRYRIRLLGMAASCYVRGDGLSAKQLSRRAKELGAEYARLNMTAMLALEEERSQQGVSTLDLHGFHVDEAIDVMRRRVQLCIAKRVSRLSIVIGRGLHSHRGKSTVFPAVLKELSSVPQLLKVTSVKQASIDVKILLDYL